MNRIVSIPEINVERFENRIEQLKRVAERIGGSVVAKKVNEEVVEIEYDGRQYKAIYHNYEVNSESPRINGFEFVAILERIGDKNLIKHINKEHELPEGLEERGNYCEHCNSNRNRRILFIIKDTKSNKIMQVGKSCLKDYIGHVSADDIANLYKNIETIDEIPLTTSVREWAHYNTIEVVAFSAYFTDIYGYESVDNKLSTKDRVYDAITLDYDDMSHIIKDKGYYEVAEDVLEWIRGSKSNNDYMVNLRTLAESQLVAQHHMGYMVSAYSSYLRSNNTNRKDEHKNESKYVGKVGDRCEFELQLSGMFSFETQYGTMRIYKFTDNLDNVFIWKTSTVIRDLELGDKVIVTGTIKEHKEYNNERQTVLTRCRTVLV